jgi:hypothetical protein
MVKVRSSNVGSTNGVVRFAYHLSVHGFDHCARGEVLRSVEEN